MAQSVIMVSKKKAKESAERAILRFDTERKLTKHLSEKMSDHPFLKADYDYRSDRKQLEDDVKGLVEKFKIHGYEDRGGRLNYLQVILRQKYAENSEMFATVMRFLILMSESPTNVIHMQLRNEDYNVHLKHEENLERERNLETLSDLLQEKDDRMDIRYSSDSELSDWDISDSEDLSEKLQKLTQEKCKVRLSRSFSEFSRITQISEEDKRKAMELYWQNQAQESKLYMETQLRHVELLPMQSQPIISSLLTLHSKFGEYWEWKTSIHSHKQRVKQLILEEDVIREILWKISDPNPEHSIVFNCDWKLKNDLMVSSLSQSILTSFMEKYRIFFTKLHQLQNFVNEVMGCVYDDLTIPTKPPKLYRAYAHSVSEILNHLRTIVASIEKNLKKECWSEGNPQPATTLIQMDKQLRTCFEIINVVKRFHDQGVMNWKEDANSNPPTNWYCSVKLISCLEMYLNLQTRPKEYGIVLFIFSKCIRAFFEEILISFETLEWNCDDFYFKRDSNVNILDCDFWINSIRLQPYGEMLKKETLTPLLSLEKLMPKVATILKTMEMLKQLGEDYKVVVGKISSSRSVVNDFMVKLLPKTAANEQSESLSDLEPQPDFNAHFRFLGLDESFVADSFRFIVCPEDKKTVNGHSYSLKDFVEIPEIPVSVPGEILNEVVKNWINPYYTKSQHSIQSIFENYCVANSMAIFREIILEGREDFAKAVSKIASDDNKSERFHYEDPLNRNPKFQLLLDECYPEGREHFQIDFMLEHASRQQYKLGVTLNFPLNIILSPRSVGGYTYISMQLQKVRNSLWRMHALSMKDCKPTQNLELNRALILRFSMIHYCSSILSFLLFKIFNKSVESVDLWRINDEEDVDTILNGHEKYLSELEIKLFKHPLFEKIILQQMVSMTQVLSESWSKDISAKTVIIIEDTLKKCWAVIASDSRSNLVAPGSDFADLSSQVGPPPTYL